MSRFATKLLFSLPVLMLAAGCAVLRVEDEPSAVPVSAEGKNLCLLESENCPGRKMTITELIQGLREELSKGEAVYNPAELRRLETKLREYEYMYDRLMFGNND